MCLVCLFMFIVLVVCCVSVFVVGVDLVLYGCLFGWVMLQFYQFVFKVDLCQVDFFGYMVIIVKLLQVFDYVWLYGVDLKVFKVVVIDVVGKIVVGKYVVVVLKEGVVCIDFGCMLKLQIIILVIDYFVLFNQQLQGLYKVSYEGQFYVMMQMELISVCYVFFGFDEFGIKMLFDIIFIVLKDENVVVNIVQVKEVDDGNGWKMFIFLQIKLLLIYLVVFGVGLWDIVNGLDIKLDDYCIIVLLLCGVVVKGEGYCMQYVFSEILSIIYVLEDYYGFGYLWDKFDLLVVLDFFVGVMENLGLVIFCDWLLLFDLDFLVQYVCGLFNVIVYELVYQWIGDIVIIVWWNDIWFNEVFVIWMQQKVMMKVYLEYCVDLDCICGVQGVMNNDSLVSVCKICQEIIGNGDIMIVFDGIIYQKGVVVLGMFENYVMLVVFQQGMCVYIQVYKFGNVIVDDLVDLIVQVVDKGVDFKNVFKSFFNQFGVFYVQMKLEQKDGQIILYLSQSCYLLVGFIGDSVCVWGVLVCVCYGIVDGSKVSCEMFDKVQGLMMLVGVSNLIWVMFNVGVQGYYCFGMIKVDFVMLGKQIGLLVDIEQLVYVDVVSVSFCYGDIDVGDVLVVFKLLVVFKIDEVVIVLLGIFEWIWGQFVSIDVQCVKFIVWVKDVYLLWFELLGYCCKVGEVDGDLLMCSMLVNFFGMDVKLLVVCVELFK